MKQERSVNAALLLAGDAHLHAEAWRRYCYILDEKFSALGRLVGRNFEFCWICRCPNGLNVPSLGFPLQQRTILNCPEKRQAF